MDEKKKRIKIRVNHSKEAFFTDNLTVIHSPKKFVIDFCQSVPRFDNINGKIDQTLSINHNTIIMDPHFAKVLLKTLEQNLKNYENSFGQIKIKKHKEKKLKATEPEVTTRYIG